MANSVPPSIRRGVHSTRAIAFSTKFKLESSKGWGRILCSIRRNALRRVVRKPPGVAKKPVLRAHGTR